MLEIRNKILSLQAEELNTLKFVFLTIRYIHGLSLNDVLNLTKILHFY